MFKKTKRNVPHTPWNKGKLIGQKSPLSLQDIWSIRMKLHNEGRLRDLALFNLGLDSKLQGLRSAESSRIGRLKRWCGQQSGNCASTEDRPTGSL